MKKALLFFLFLQISLFTYAQCYEPLRTKGIALYKTGDFTNALLKFNNAKACADKPNTNDLEDYITKCNAGIAKNSSNKLDEAAWKRAEAANTLESYNQYLSKYPNGLHVGDYNDEIAWIEAKKTNTLEGYRSYLRKYSRNDVACKNSIITAEAQYKVQNLPEMVKITGGTFIMGGEDEIITDEIIINAKQQIIEKKDARTVKEKKVAYFKLKESYDAQNNKPKITLTDYYIGKYEVTNKQYAEFLNYYQKTETKSTSDYPNKYMGDGKYINFEKRKYIPKIGYEDFPISLTWYGAYEYCKWLSEKTGKKYSLPSEAQWEYAAGGGSLRQIWSGTRDAGLVGQYAWSIENSDSIQHKVGTKNPNNLGIYDMSGNVSEWCMDWYAKNYFKTSALLTNPINTNSDTLRVIRGGNYYWPSSDCKITDRSQPQKPEQRSKNFGFRVCKMD